MQRFHRHNAANMTMRFTPPPPPPTTNTHLPISTGALTCMLSHKLDGSMPKEETARLYFGSFSQPTNIGTTYHMVEQRCGARWNIFISPSVWLHLLLHAPATSDMPTRYYYRLFLLPPPSPAVLIWLLVLDGNRGCAVKLLHATSCLIAFRPGVFMRADTCAAATLPARTAALGLKFALRRPYGCLLPPSYHLPPPPCPAAARGF